jgi:cytochrome bd-type quinol oxidase subunit 2
MTFTLPLARAPAETLNTNLLLVLVAAGVAAVVALLAAVAIVTANRRHHRLREAIAGLAILWAIVASAAVVWAVNRDWTASAERERQIESGDVDPRELPPDAAQPWALWGGVVCTYLALLGWTVSSRRESPGDAGV